MGTDPDASVPTMPGSRPQALWSLILLGLVLIVCGVVVLGDLALATAVSTVLIGALAIVGGGIQ